MHNLKYSAAEINTLRHLFKKESLATIARRLGRSEGSVANKAKELGLSKQSLWTPHEIGVLIEYLPVRGAEFVSRLIGKPISAIIIKAHQLGIVRRTEGGTNGQ